MKKLALFFALLGAPASAFAQGSFLPPQTAFKNINGIVLPIANATITTCAAGASGIPCSPALVGAIFKDVALSQALSNPFTADANGNYQFAATPGTYTVTATASGFSGYSYQVTLGASAPGNTIYSNAFANLTAAFAACPSQGTVIVSTVIPAPVTASQPAGCSVQFQQGGMINVSSGQTVTLGGNVVAGPYQIFTGAGTVTGLSTILPEWFGAAAVSTSVQSAFASGGGTLIFQNKTYSSGFATGTCWTQPNVWFKGAGEPVANSSFTALSGGTIIQGGFAGAGANNLHFTDLGIDNGSAFSGVSTNDGLVVTGTTGCSSSTPSDALVTGTYIENVISMLSSGAALFHAIRVEHNTGAQLRNLTSYFGTHGLALKSVNSSLIGYTAFGQGSDALIFKADAYTATANEIATHIFASTISSANLLLNGIILDSEVAQPLTNITVDDWQVVNAQTGLQLLSNGTVGAGALNGINISNGLFVVNSSSVGLTTVQCILSSTSTSETALNVHGNGISCINLIGGVVLVPFSGSMPMNNSEFDATTIAGSNSNGSTFNGVGLTFNGFTSNSDTATKVGNIANSATVNFLGSYQGALSLSGITIGTSASLNVDAHLGAAAGHYNSDGVYFGGKTVSVAALSTATILPNSTANTGLLTLRDNTLGGSAIFQIDPNGGTVLLGTSNITGITTGAAVTFSAGVWHVTLASGAVPRVIAFTFYD